MYLISIVKKNTSTIKAKKLFKKYFTIYEPPEGLDRKFHKLAYEDDLSEHMLGGILAELLKGDVFADSDGNGHIWNESKRIWQFKKAGGLATEVAKLRPFAKKSLKLLKDEIKKVKDDDTLSKSEMKEKTSAINQTVKAVKYCRRVTIGGVQKMRCVFASAAYILQDDEFADKLNKHKDLFPTDDGCVVDLRTGIARPRTRLDLFSFEAPCHMLTTPTPLAVKFMNSMFDDEVRGYMRNRLGAFLTGVPMREIDIWYGCGKNGKTVLVRLISMLTGAFSTNANRGIFIDQDKFTNSSGHTSHIIPIIGKRLITCTEIKKNDVLNSTMLKGLSGGDEIAYRGAYASEEKTFVSEAKCILAVNDRPRFDAEDQAIIDRLRYIPFNSRFVEENPQDGEQIADRDFIEELMSGPGLCDLFTYLVTGAKNFYARKCLLDAPASVLQAKAENVADADHLAQFLAEKYERYGSNEQFKAMASTFIIKGKKDKPSRDFCKTWNVSPEMLRSEFNRYLASENVEGRTKTDFKKDMMKRGYLYERNGKKPREFFGLRRMDIDGDDEDSDSE